MYSSYNPMDCRLRGFSVQGDSLSKNTGVGCHFLLQGILPTQELNSGLLHCRHCRQILYWLSYVVSSHLCVFVFMRVCIYNIMYIYNGHIYISDSVWPHRWQPTRLPRLWDSPGKNTGVGCHFLLQCMKGKSESEVTQSCPTLHDPMDCSLPGSSIHGIFQARVLEWSAIAFSIYIMK